jgi:hypothetical protein
MGFQINVCESATSISSAQRERMVATIRMTMATTMTTWAPMVIPIPTIRRRLSLNPPIRHEDRQKDHGGKPQNSHSHE